MSLYSEQHDKKILKVLGRIASSLEKIEKNIHVKDKAINDIEMSGSKYVECSRCGSEISLSKKHLEDIVNTGSLYTRCPCCGNYVIKDNISLDDLKTSKKLVDDYLKKFAICPRCKMKTALTDGYLEELETYGETNVYCSHCTNLFEVRKEK